MTTNKHTPGKWSVGATDPDTAEIEIVSEGRPYICLVLPGAVDDRTEANARLIAAAPDLLEACQTFSEWLRREEAGFPAETRFGTPDGEAKWREWYFENLRICDLAQTLARDAIAKATGGAA